MAKLNKSCTGTAADKADYVMLSWYSNFFSIAKLGYDVLLVGPSSSGKTIAAYALAKRLGYDLVIQQGHRRVESEALIGSRSIVPGPNGHPVTGFDPGTLLHSLQLCKKAAGVVFLIDEVNLIDPGMLACLNNILQRDEHSRLYVPEMERDFPRPNNWKFIGTMNPDYIGTHPLSQAFISRPVLLETPVMKRSEALKVLHLNYPSVPAHRLAIVGHTMQVMHQLRNQGRHDWDVDIRTMFQLLDYWIIAEPNFSIGLGVNNYLTCVDAICGPKIGYIDGMGPTRKAIIKGMSTYLSKIVTSLPVGSNSLGEDDEEIPIDEVLAAIDQAADEDDD